MENKKERRAVRVLFWIWIAIVLLPEVWFAYKVSVILSVVLTTAQLFVTGMLFVFLLIEQPVVEDTLITFHVRRNRPLKTHLLFFVGLIFFIVGDIFILAFKGQMMGMLLSDVVSNCRQLAASGFALWYLCFVIDIVVIDQHRYKESNDVIMRWFFNRSVWIRLFIFTIGIPTILIFMMRGIAPSHYVLFQTAMLIGVSSLSTVFFISFQASWRYIQRKKKAKQIEKTN